MRGECAGNAWGMRGKCVGNACRCGVGGGTPLLLWPCIAGLSGANPSMGLREPTGVDAAEEALEPL
eukprot:6695093-Prymnesium_polylepis.1